jgi:flagellar biosynthesis protein FliQ
MSLGEERTSGTHAWHLTLPVPALLQWRVKLYMALLAGLVGAGLLPMLTIGRFMLRSSHTLGDMNLGIGWLLAVLLLTFAAFWCACAVNGTVPAVLWVLPVMIAIGLAGEFGEWAGRALMNLVISRFDLFATFKFTSAVVMRFQLSEGLQFVAWGLYGYHYLSPMLGYILGPTLLLAIFQSYRLFRTQVQNSTLSVVRKLLPLAMMAFLCTFLPAALGTFVFHALDQYWRAESETLRAIEKTPLSTAKMDAAHPLQLTTADLAKASPLSEHTRRWLGKSAVTIAPLKVPPSLDMRFWGGWGLARTIPFEDYLATIHFGGGNDCSQRFWWVGYPKRDKRLLVLICK